MVAFLLIILLALPSTLFVTKLRHPRIDQFRSDFREWAIIRCVERLDSITDPTFQHPGVVRFFAERQWLRMPPALTSEPVTPSNTCARRRLFPNPWTCPFDQPPSHVITPPNTCARPTLFPDFQLCPFDQLEPSANIRIDIPAEVPPTLAVRLDLQRTLCCVIVLEFLVICLLVIKCLNKSNVGAESSPSVRRQEQIAQVHPAVPLDAALAGPTHQMIDPEFLDAQLAVEIAAPIDDDSDSTTLEDVVAQDNSIDRAMGTSIDEDDDVPSDQDTTDQRRTEDQQCSSELDREQPSAVTSWFLQTSGPSNVSLADPLREYDPREVSSDENGYPGFYNTSNPFYANGITPTNDSGQLSRPRICPGVNSVLAAINTSDGLDHGSGSGGHACTEVSIGRSDYLTTVVSNRDLPETGELLRDESSPSSPATTFELEEADDMQVSQAQDPAAPFDPQLSSFSDEAGDVCMTDGRMSTSTSASSSSSEGNYPWQAHYVDPDSSTPRTSYKTQASQTPFNFLFPRTHLSTRYRRDDYNFDPMLTASLSCPASLHLSPSPTLNESVGDLLTDRDTSDSPSVQVISTFAPTNESLVDFVHTNSLTVESALQPSDSGSLSFLSPETPTELRHRRRAYNFDTSLTPSPSHLGPQGSLFPQESARSGENMGADANACTRTVEDVAIAPLASATDKADPLPTTSSAPTERRIVLRDMGNEGAESAGASGSGPSRSPTANESIVDLLTDGDISNLPSTQVVSTFAPANESLVASVRTNGLTVESALQSSDSGSLSFLVPETPTELRRRRRAFNFDTSLTPSPSHLGPQGSLFPQESARSGENMGADANACTRTVEDVAIAPLASATDKAGPLPTTPSAPTERRVVLRDMGNEGAESAGASGSGPSRSPTANESIVDLLTDGDISNLPSTQVVSTFAPTNESLVDSVRTNGLTVESALQSSDSGDLSFLVPETPTELRRRRRAFNFDPSLTPSPSHSDSEGSWFNQESTRSGENMGADTNVNGYTRSVEDSDVAVAPPAAATDKAESLAITSSAPTERRVVLRDMGNDGSESVGASGSGLSR